MKLGGKHRASLNDWKSLGSLRWFKLHRSLPPRLPLFLPFLAVSFLLSLPSHRSRLREGAVTQL